MVAEPTRGPFVTVEGLDFSGKSTLVSRLKDELAGLDPPVYFTREPGGAAAAERVRALLLDPELEMAAWTEAYLYAAARAELVTREILPRLGRGETVVCERFLDSSVAYQGYGRGLGAREVRDLNSWAVGTVVPDMTFYLRLDGEERARRARGSEAPLDRIERVGDEFMGRVEVGFEEISRAEPGRVRVLDASLPPAELAGTVRDEILGLRAG
ncbi:dTMP kinase [Rubrobacter marinus]|uniref:dTMP kinase n=1 Tax=Rubrobacter marinus TaxID=2653852 RepID=UPI00140DB01E|nr:dTMP kinase [Rubrobacter marinus]